MIVLFLYVSTTFLCSSQEKTYYFYTPTQIEYNRKHNKHERYRIIQTDEKKLMFVIGDVSEFNDLMDVSAIYFGNFTQNGDTLVCNDDIQKCIIKFRRINQFTIEAMNTTNVFKKGDRFYVGSSNNYDDNCSYKSYLYPSDLIHSQYWHNGLREGIHSYNKNGKTQLIYYSNGNAIDSIITINSDSLNAFIHKYHK